MNKTEEKELKVKIEYKVSCMLNELGVVAYDFSDAGNNAKLEEVKKQIFDLVKSLPSIK